MYKYFSVFIFFNLKEKIEPVVCVILKINIKIIYNYLNTLAYKNELTTSPTI